MFPTQAFYVAIRVLGSDLTEATGSKKHMIVRFGARVPYLCREWVVLSPAPGSLGELGIGSGWQLWLPPAVMGYWT